MTRGTFCADFKLYVQVGLLVQSRIIRKWNQLAFCLASAPAITDLWKFKPFGTSGAGVCQAPRFFTISELNQIIKGTLEQELDGLLVVG